MRDAIDFDLDTDDAEQILRQLRIVREAGDDFWIRLMQDGRAINLFQMGDRTTIGGKRYEVDSLNPNGTIRLRRVP